MKITDDDIKKAFEQVEIPEPSESAKNKAVHDRARGLGVERYIE